MNINTCGMFWKMVSSDVNHTGCVVHGLKHAKPPVQYTLSVATCVCHQVVETQEGRVVHHPPQSPKKHSTTTSQRSTGSVCCCRQPQRTGARLTRHTDRMRDRQTGTEITELTSPHPTNVKAMNHIQI